MARNKKYTDILNVGVDLIDYYLNNPCIAAYDLLGVDLAPIQRLVFEDMWFKSYVVGICSRGLGKTFLLGTLSTLSALLRPGYRVGLMSSSFRQAKFIFAEVEKLYDKSSILREACEKKPINATGGSYLKFKSVAGLNASYIEALPLGNDGSKIRGSRFYLLGIDELAQVPDNVIDLVIRPMGATSMNPMEKVRRIEEQKRLIKLGLAKESDFEQEAANKMVMVSSGYFKFNHMWRRMKDYWYKMDLAEKNNEECPYSVWQIPYWDLPEGFADKDNIEEAKRVMPSALFKMEYEAAMISDTEGFFTASLLESCTNNSEFSIEIKGDGESNYILGVDPNQGGSASTGIVVIKTGSPNKIVNVIELKNNTTQALTKAVQQACKDYNVLRIFMDKGGGGNALKDLLEEGYNNEVPIIDRTNDDHKHLQGRHILEMVNFNPTWISDANFTTKAMLENKNLLFPNPPHYDSKEILNKFYKSVETLKNQMLNIVVTQNSSGSLHFDTPVKGQDKDLYSSLILAAHGVKEVEKELEDRAPILYNHGGLIRFRDDYSGDFNVMNNRLKTGNFIINNSALLKKSID